MTNANRAAFHGLIALGARGSGAKSTTLPAGIKMWAAGDEEGTRRGLRPEAAEIRNVRRG